MASPADAADRKPTVSDEPGSVDAQLELWRLRDAVVGAEAAVGELRARLAVAEHTVATLRRPATRRGRALGRATGVLRRLPGSEATRQRAEATLRSFRASRR